MLKEATDVQETIIPDQGTLILDLNCFFWNLVSLINPAPMRKALAELRHEEAVGPYKDQIRLERVKQEQFYRDFTHTELLILEVPGYSKRAEMLKKIQRDFVRDSAGFIHLGIQVQTVDDMRISGGRVNLENGLVGVGDQIIGRIRGAELYLLREMAGWEDPTGWSKKQEQNRSNTYVFQPMNN